MPAESVSIALKLVPITLESAEVLLLLITRPVLYTEWSNRLLAAKKVMCDVQHYFFLLCTLCRVLASLFKPKLFSLFLFFSSRL